MPKKSLTKLMYQFKSTGDEEVLAEILKRLNKYIKGTSRRKATHSPTGLHTAEDLENIANETVWSSINKFQFYCPRCKLIALTEKDYRVHCKNAHGKSYLKPRTSIIKYVKYRIGTYQQNAIKTEYSKKNKCNIGTVAIFTPDFEDETHSKSEIETLGLDKLFGLTEDISNEAIFNQLLSISKKHLDNNSLEILKYLLLHMKQRHIAELFVEQGKYKSVESAAVMVSRIIKNKIAPYFTWLLESKSQLA